MKWQADRVPRYGLMIKYLRKLMTKKELDDLLKRYVEMKQSELEKNAARARAPRGKKI